jgi:hypothetical protein
VITLRICLNDMTRQPSKHCATSSYRLEKTRLYEPLRLRPTEPVLTKQRTFQHEQNNDT